MKLRFVFLAAAALAACEPMPEQSPMQRHVNRVAGAELAQRECPAYGGYGAVAQMRADAAANWQQAQALGATEADLAAARDLIGQRHFSNTLAFGPDEACRQLVSGLAWAGTAPAGG